RALGFARPGRQVCKLATLRAEAMKTPTRTLSPQMSATAGGIACGTGAALFWAGGFVAARHGIAAGFSPADIAFHRFVSAGLMFAIFALLLRLWRITPMQAVAITSVVSLVDVPIHWLAFGFERMIGLGLAENLLQLVVQGVFAGAGATYLFARSVALLGAGRAAVFPSLVPGFTLLIGYLVLGEVPSLAQLA